MSVRVGSVVLGSASQSDANYFRIVKDQSDGAKRGTRVSVTYGPPLVTLFSSSLLKNRIRNACEENPSRQHFKKYARRWRFARRIAATFNGLLGQARSAPPHLNSILRNSGQTIHVKARTVRGREFWQSRLTLNSGRCKRLLSRQS